MASKSVFEAAARYGIDVQDMTIDALHDVSGENARLRKIILEAQQHLEHGRPSHALAVLDQLED